MSFQANQPNQANEAEPADAARLRALLERRPFGLFLDIDGTISPLAATPREAVVPREIRDLLHELSRLIHVVIVSGRTLVDARRMVGVDSLIYVGSHGLATWIDGREELDGAVLPYVRFAQRAMVELAPLRRIDGILFEEKGTGLAIHFRLTRDGAEARAAILRGIAASGSSAHFDLLEGVKVIELRPRLGLNKGTSVRTLVNRLRLDGLLYAGDDITDIEAFEVVRDLRRGGRVDGVSVCVLHPDSSPLVERASDYTVEGVDGTRRLLEYARRRLDPARDWREDSAQ